MNKKSKNNNIINFQTRKFRKNNFFIRTIDSFLDKFLGQFFRTKTGEMPIKILGIKIWHRNIYSAPNKNLTKIAKRLFLIVLILAIATVFILLILKIPRWILIVIGVIIFAPFILREIEKPSNK